jgi:hypothetical protein
MRFAVSTLAVLIAVLAIFAAAPTSAFGRNPTHLTPDQIKSMPITERPNRPGHFYGNTVRFFHHLRAR